MNQLESRVESDCTSCWPSPSNRRSPLRIVTIAHLSISRVLLEWTGDHSFKYLNK